MLEPHGVAVSAGRFYATSPLGRCDCCPAPATREIRGPFNAKYGATCARHERRRIAELERAHADTREFPRR